MSEHTFLTASPSLAFVSAERSSAGALSGWGRGSRVSEPVSSGRAPLVHQYRARGSPKYEKAATRLASESW